MDISGDLGQNAIASGIMAATMTAAAAMHAAFRVAEAPMRALLITASGSSDFGSLTGLVRFAAEADRYGEFLRARDRFDDLDIAKMLPPAIRLRCGPTF